MAFQINILFGGSFINFTLQLLFFTLMYTLQLCCIFFQFTLLNQLYPKLAFSSFITLTNKTCKNIGLLSKLKKIKIKKLNLELHSMTLHHPSLHHLGNTMEVSYHHLHIRKYSALQFLYCFLPFANQAHLCLSTS